MASTERSLRKREVALGYRLLAALGWGDTGDGHISARDPEQPDHFWLLRMGVPFGTATVFDLVLVAPDGSLADGVGHVNKAGYHIHQPLLAARPDVVSACHTHTEWGTPFSAEARTFEPITQEACIFFEDHAMFDDDEVQVQSTAAGARIAEALGQHGAVILRNHGLLTVGASVAGAVAKFIIMERVAEAHMKALRAKPIPPDAARFAQADLTRDGAAESSFQFLVAHHVGDPSVAE